MDTLLLKPEEAAAELRLSRATLYELLGSGRLASVTIGRARRIPRTALCEFIGRLADEQQREPMGQGGRGSLGSSASGAAEARFDDLTEARARPNRHPGPER